VLLAVVSFAFDVSVLELLWTMTRGFLVVIQEDQFDRRGIVGGDEYGPAAQMRRYGVTHLFCIPSFARTLLLDPAARAALRPLRVIWLGGEVLTPALAQQLGELVDGDIFNVYGPTEVAVWSHTERVRPGAQLITLGRPVPNAEVYILDAQLQPAPIGVAGEICIGGHGVGRGYLRRPDLTAERFIPNPFTTTDDRRPTTEQILKTQNSKLKTSGCTGPATWAACCPTGGWSSWAGSTTRSSCAASASRPTRSSGRLRRTRRSARRWS
jgi:non-ribosomal peptide synthetase component F